MFFFDLIPNTIDAAITVLLPIFASYKALRTSSPAQLTPWLMYWVILSLFHLVESYFNFITSWIPFFAWFRLFAHLYLILPGMQGATYLYLTYFEPTIARHESEIEDFIAKAHDRARAAGLQYFKHAVEWARIHVLKQAAVGSQYASSSASARTDAARLGSRDQQQQQTKSQSYTQNLLSRFNLPAPAAASTEAYGVLASALQGVMGGGVGVGFGTGASAGSRESQARDLSSSGSLVPPDLGGEERLSYIAAQKERLGILMRAFEREAEAGDALAYGDDTSRAREGAIRKSKSEMEFDTIDRDEAGSRVSKSGSGGSWMPWLWAGKGDDVSAEKKKQ